MYVCLWKCDVNKRIRNSCILFFHERTSVFHCFLWANILYFGEKKKFTFWRKHLFRFEVLCFGMAGPYSFDEKPLLMSCGNTGASVIYAMKWQELMNHTQAQREKKMNNKKINKSQASNPHQQLQQQLCNKLLLRYHQIKQCHRNNRTSSPCRDYYRKTTVWL